MSASRLYQKITPYAALIAPSARVLEIGPLDRPILTKDTHSNLFYADIRSTEEIRTHYAGDPNVDMNHICAIDFVIKGSYASTLARARPLDWVIHSHVLEHMPDLIDFFNDMAAILGPGGRLAMTIPDKRYGADVLRTPTTFGEVYDVSCRGSAALAARCLDCAINTQSLYSREDLWAKEADTEKMLKQRGWGRPAAALEYYERAAIGRTGPIHFHVFTPGSFLVLAADLLRFGFSSFVLNEFYDTQPGRHEFNVVLARAELTEDEKAAEYERLIEMAAATAKLEVSI